MHAGGELVPKGWGGKDTGSNWCNNCVCVDPIDNIMACTEAFCIGPQTQE